MVAAVISVAAPTPMPRRLFALRVKNVVLAMVNSLLEPIGGSSWGIRDHVATG
ncbi:hypothetical protein L083_2526 [Actinoplanes sp. N902-109]|nr:hypothetical protein L083_2526 [Actinoplanes sp. N902-109]